MQSFRWDHLSVELEISSAVNFSLAHCGISPITRLSAKNEDSRPSKESCLDISIVGCGLTESILVPALNPYENRDLAAPQFRFNYEALEGQVERARRRVNIQLNGLSPQGNPVECSVLPHNEWSLSLAHRISLGAFVLPNHPLVVQLEHDACQQVPLSSPGMAVLEAVYTHLCTLWKLTYRHEPFNLQAACQRIRLPHQILLDSLRKLGQGTCLDLALLVAGCLESYGVQPLVAIIDIHPGKHALCGFWKRPKPGLEPLIFDKERLQTDAIWIDATGMTRDSDRRLGFEDSCVKARTCMSECTLEFALDVAAARGDGIAPLPFAGLCHWSEAAARILREAEHVADTVPTRLATVPLLVSLLKEQDGLTRTVFAARFENVDPILARLVATLPKQPDSRKPSRNYVLTLDMARANAKADCSPLVLERHILQALLNVEGTAVDEALAGLGTSRLELRSVMYSAMLDRRPSSYSAFSEFSSTRHSV